MPLCNLNAILITNSKLKLTYSSNTTIQSCIALHYVLYQIMPLQEGPFGLGVSTSIFFENTFLKP